MNTIDFRCVISSTNPQIPLGMEIWLDDHKFFDQDRIDRIFSVAHTMPDDDGEHEIRFVLKNKSPDHTQVDEHGNIVTDTTLCVNNVEFDGIDCQYLMTKLAQYQHDFNGTGEPTQDRFYGKLGCNGTVSMRFSTPIYIWLLENM
jgi:hypothetical protein